MTFRRNYFSINGLCTKPLLRGLERSTDRESKRIDSVGAADNLIIVLLYTTLSYIVNTESIIFMMAYYSLCMIDPWRNILQTKFDMGATSRRPGQTAISVSLSKELLAKVDERVESLGLSRSQYIVILVRNDLESRGPLKIGEDYPKTGNEAGREDILRVHDAEGKPRPTTSSKKNRGVHTETVRR